MCSKRQIAAIAVFIVLAVALAAGSLPYAGQAGEGKAQVCIPKLTRQLDEGMDIAMLADVLDGKVVYTYESQTNAMLKNDLRSVSVSLFSVNHAYARVTGLRLLNGSFFVKVAEDMRYRHIVLNRTAAFKLFGGADIVGQAVELEGQSYEVVGVLEDGRDDAAAYVPAVLTEAKAQAVMALPDEANGLSAAHVLNLLKQAGVTKQGFDIVDVGKLNAMMPGKALFVGTAVPVLAGIALIVAGARRMRRCMAAWCEQNGRHYAGALLWQNKRLLTETAAVGLTVLGAAVGLFALGLAWMDWFLVYDPMRLMSEWSVYTGAHFNAVLAPLCEANLRSTIGLGLSAVAFCFAIFTTKRAGEN